VTETKVESIDSIKIDDSNKIGFVVHAINTAKKITIDADMVVHGAGRVPEIDDLDLGAASVQSEKREV
jgi:glutathione reductase (NADPH)